MGLCWVGNKYSLLICNLITMINTDTIQYRVVRKWRRGDFSTYSCHLRPLLFHNFLDSAQQSYTIVVYFARYSCRCAPYFKSCGQPWQYSESDFMVWGTGHHLWPGGPGGKSGGATKIFWWTKSGLGKKIEKARVGIEIFLPRKFSPLTRHSFTVFYTLQTTFKQVELANIFPMKIDLLYSWKVGVEKLSRDVEWAANFFVRAPSGPRKFFS